MGLRYNFVCINSVGLETFDFVLVISKNQH